MAYGDFKDLNRKIDPDNVLSDKTLYTIMHYNLYNIISGVDPDYIHFCKC